MKLLIGFLIVIGSVIGGYVLHGGKLGVLYQPTEYLIIVGAAVGSLVIGSPGKLIKYMLKSMKYLMKGPPHSKKSYLELLTMMAAAFKLIRTKGMLEMESHIENPHESTFFANYPKFYKNHHAVVFFCDYLRVISMGMEDRYQLEDMMDRDLEEIKQHGHHTGMMLQTMGDSMPALGIVAAVLGVIITMGSITEPPEILGHLIGAALVGTFLGVLLSYGFVSPMGRMLCTHFEEEDKYLEVIKVGLLSHLKGNAPVISVEMARSAIPPDDKPTFQEVEEALNADPAPAAK